MKGGVGAPLDEAVVGLELEEDLFGHEVVVDAVDLTGARAAGRVRDGEREGVRVSLEGRKCVSGIADCRSRGGGLGV